MASVWQEDSTDPAGFLGVVSFADPHFNRRWTTQMTVLPEGGTWPKNGMLGTRPKWDDSELEGLQVWCLPGDPVCQDTKTLKDWHGWEYDCYEDWAAFRLAERSRTAPHPGRLGCGRADRAGVHAGDEEVEGQHREL